MKYIIKDLNPKSDDLQAREDDVNIAFQNLKDAITNYTQTDEHCKRKYGEKDLLSALGNIENELKNIGSQVHAHIVSVAGITGENGYTK
jgi:hypothetical protein